MVHGHHLPASSSMRGTMGLTLEKNLHFKVQKIYEILQCCNGGRAISVNKQQITFLKQNIALYKALDTSVRGC